MSASMNLEQMHEQSQHLSSMLTRIRATMLSPIDAKAAPEVGARRLADLCQIGRQTVYQWAATDSSLPAASAVAGGHKSWAADAAAEWVRRARPNVQRPEGAQAISIAVANFKGGVTKTTTAVALAQGLAQRGHRVLVVDLDPQGSATTLFGVLPDTDVPAEATALELFSGATDTIDSKVRGTYWPGIDLVPASPALFASEYEMPRRQAAQPLLDVSALLYDGLINARQTYDAIVIDTPPSLSFLTINALVAAQGLIMPIPPSAIDFASSTQFWGLLTDILRTEAPDKQFEFVDVLMSRVDTSDSAAAIVRGWLSAGYEQHMLTAEIPKSNAVAVASAELGTIYDLQRGDVDRRTLSKAVEAYDAFVEQVLSQMVATWAPVAPKPRNSAKRVKK